MKDFAFVRIWHFTSSQEMFIGLKLYALSRNFLLYNFIALFLKGLFVIAISLFL